MEVDRSTKWIIRNPLTVHSDIFPNGESVQSTDSEGMDNWGIWIWYAIYIGKNHRYLTMKKMSWLIVAEIYWLEMHLIVYKRLLLFMFSNLSILGEVVANVIVLQISVCSIRKRWLYSLSVLTNSNRKFILTLHGILIWCRFGSLGLYSRSGRTRLTVRAPEVSK